MILNNEYFSLFILGGFGGGSGGSGFFRLVYRDGFFVFCGHICGEHKGVSVIVGEVYFRLCGFVVRCVEPEGVELVICVCRPADVIMVVFAVLSDGIFEP